MAIETIKWVDGAARIIDQTKLPNAFEYIHCRDVQTMWDAIKRLSVRGAPAIGVAGAFGVVLGANNFKGDDTKKFITHVHAVCDHLSTSRPTAVNLFTMIERMRRVLVSSSALPILKIKKALFIEAMGIYEEDRLVCRTMGDHGAVLIKNGMRALTVCNAGALATVDYGTALGVLLSLQHPLRLRFLIGYIQINEANGIQCPEQLLFVMGKICT